MPEEPILGCFHLEPLSQVDFSTRSELLRAGVIPADVGGSLASTIQTIIPIIDERSRYRRACDA